MLIKKYADLKSCFFCRCSCVNLIHTCHNFCEHFSGPAQKNIPILSVHLEKQTSVSTIRPVWIVETIRGAAILKLLWYLKKRETISGRLRHMAAETTFHLRHYAVLSEYQRFAHHYIGSLNNMFFLYWRIPSPMCSVIMFMNYLTVILIHEYSSCTHFYSYQKTSYK